MSDSERFGDTPFSASRLTDYLEARDELELEAVAVCSWCHGPVAADAIAVLSGDGSQRHYGCNSWDNPGRVTR
jgi:hypothetical protein